MSDEVGQKTMPPQWVKALEEKYGQMSVLDLKKQKLMMVKDLQEINRLLDEMIVGETKDQPRSMEEIVQQIQKSKKMQRNLRRTLQNFEFMLTGDYSVRADEQIERLSTEVKVMKEQVNKFNRILSIPMQKDIEICEDLQKEVYQLEKDVEQARVKNYKRKERIAQMSEENAKKCEGIKKIIRQLQKCYGDNESEQILKNSSSGQDKKAYEQLLAKKDKLLNLIEKDQKRYAKDFKNKIKNNKLIEHASIEIEQYMRQVTQMLEEKTYQLNKAKQHKKSAAKKQRSSESNVLVKYKSYSEQSSEMENIIKYREKRSSLMRQTSERLPQTLPYVIQTPTATSTSSNLLPKLYKALGKSKLEIQEDCDVKDLLY